MPALYRRLLGSVFDQLPSTLREFHDIEMERHFRALFTITRGRGPLRGLLARLGKLPPAGEDVPVRLRVVPDGEGEIWMRDFGGHRLESRQWAADGLLVESFGTVRMAFRLAVEGPSLRLHSAGAWVLGIPWPRWLAPGGSGVEVGEREGVAIVARASAPLLGMLVQYEGMVLPGDGV